MRTKHEIEIQIEHFKSACHTPAAEKEIWIQALEWVLGNPEHRSAYDAWVDSIDPSQWQISTPTERALHYFLESARSRLR